jgi:hypothetical protein
MLEGNPSRASTNVLKLLAFGKEVFWKQGVYCKTRVDLGKPLTHYGIIVHIRKAYDRWIKLMEKTNGK